MKALKSGDKQKVSVDPPEGYHWMEERGRYYLMRGDYSPHPNAIEKAMFKTTTHPKGKK